MLVFVLLFKKPAWHFMSNTPFQKMAFEVQLHLIFYSSVEKIIMFFIVLYCEHEYLLWNIGENEVAFTVTSSKVQLDLSMAIL